MGTVTYKHKGVIITKTTEQIKESNREMWNEIYDKLEFTTIKFTKRNTPIQSEKFRDINDVMKSYK